MEWKGYEKFLEESIQNFQIIKGNGYIKEELFEGEYINGERNGKGKEYCYSNWFEKSLKFEGEYLNGKKNGMGREYYCYSHALKFEDYYLNDKIWTGKGFDKKGNIIYEIKEGKGYIKEYDIYDFLIYEGEYLNGMRIGKGKEYGNSNFEGEYLNNKKWIGKGEHYKNIGNIKLFGN